MVLSAADATEIGSSGSIADGSGNNIELTLPDGTAAAVTSNGLSGLYGAAYWDLGTSLKGGLSAFIEYNTRQNNTFTCVGFKRASSAPTSLSDLETDSVFLQINIRGTGKLNCFHKKEGDNLTIITTNSDDLASCKALIYQVAAGPLGFERRQHVSYNEAEDTQKDNASATQILDTGRWYLFLAWGSSTTVSGDTTMSFKLTGGFPV